MRLPPSKRPNCSNRSGCDLQSRGSFQLRRNACTLKQWIDWEHALQPLSIQGLDLYSRLTISATSFLEATVHAAQAFAPMLLGSRM